MRTSRHLGTAVGMACSLALCQVASVGAASGVLLRYSFTAGQAHTYAINIQDSEVITTTVKQTSVFGYQFRLLQRVTKIYADGSAQLQDSFGPSSLLVNKLKEPLALNQVLTTQHVARDGSVLSTTTAGVSAQNGLTFLSGNIGTRPLLPKSSVSIGSTWNGHELFSLGLLGIFSATQSFKLTAVTAKGGHRIAQIQVSGRQSVQTQAGPTTENGTATSSGTMQFDITGGALVGLHETIQQNLKVAKTGTAVATTTTIDIVQNS